MASIVLLDAKPLLADTYTKVYSLLGNDAFFQQLYPVKNDTVLLDFYGWALRQYFKKVYGANVNDLSDRISYVEAYNSIERDITGYLTNNADATHLYRCTMGSILHVVFNGEFLILVPCQIRI